MIDGKLYLNFYYSCSTSSESNLHSIADRGTSIPYNQDTSPSAIKTSQTINVLNYPDRDRDANDSDHDYFVAKKRNNKKKRRKIYIDSIDEDYNSDDSEFHHPLDGRPPPVNDDNSQLINYSNKNNRDYSTRKKQNKNKQSSRTHSRKVDDIEEDYDSGINDDDDEDYGNDSQQSHKLIIPNHQLDFDGGVVSEVVSDDELHNTNAHDDYDYELSDESTSSDSNQEGDLSYLTKSVFDTRPRRRERPLYEMSTVATIPTPKYRRVYSRWSRWSKCSSKCTTRRFKKCRVKEICGNEVLRETAYCYVEGTFCQEWIKTQLPDSSSYSASMC